jgi:hypothetical protein
VVTKVQCTITKEKSKVVKNLYFEKERLECQEKKDLEEEVKLEEVLKLEEIVRLEEK